MAENIDHNHSSDGPDVGHSPVSKLCDDLMRLIVNLSVEVHDQPVNNCGRCRNTPGALADVRTCRARPWVLTAMVRLSHVSQHWRAVVLDDRFLWARHVEITPHTSSSNLSELVKRAKGLPLHVYFDIHGVQLPDILSWPQIVQIFSRCIFMHFCAESGSRFLPLVLITPAPILEECEIACGTPGHALAYWRPLFHGEAPKLKTLRIIRLCTPLVQEDSQAYLGGVSMTTLQSLEELTALRSLEFTFPTTQPQGDRRLLQMDNAKPIPLVGLKELRLTGEPFSVSYFLTKTALPNVTHFSITYTLTNDPIWASTDIIWRSLSLVFPAQTFMTLTIECNPLFQRFRLQHSDGRLLTLRFCGRGVTGLDPDFQSDVATFVGLPETSATARFQIVHGCVWLSMLFTKPKFMESISTVRVTSTPSNPVNRTFPHHVLFLFRLLRSVNTLRLEDIESSTNLEWYELLEKVLTRRNHLKAICVPSSTRETAVFSSDAPNLPKSISDIISFF
ncbi:hypothetical protein FA13DRAFT_1796949 [Coprinellus micaceus]|uniref:F-box domain-containing protein n=1 Tax=Coprinellus micaceus TaxID=71717 RepID=A0A4Y7SSB1_COPMI|nr:hypothetical protein FA13DRAFT_1796949 [Coprinellus micaceus]